MDFISPLKGKDTNTVASFTLVFCKTSKISENVDNRSKLWLWPQ